MENIQLLFQQVPDQMSVLLVNILLALVIYLIGHGLLRYVLKLVHQVLARRSHDVTLNGFIELALHIGLKFILIVLVLAQLGINTSSLLALLGAAGLAVGLAVKDSLAHFASGVMLIALKPFKVGDYIEAANTGGTVERISLFSTLLITGDNKKIIVPNAQIYQGTITNFSALPRRRIDLLIDIHHDACLKTAKQVLQQILSQEERVLAEPKPLVVVSAINNHGVTIMLRAWVKTSDYWKVRWALLEECKLQLDEQKINFAKNRNDINVLLEK